MGLKKLRKEEIRKRKNFFPTLIITFFLWGLTGLFIYFVEPDTFAAIPIFFVLIFFSLLFTFSIIFGNSQRGFVTTSAITIFLILRYFGIGNIINLFLIVGLALTAEIYFIKSG